MNTINRLKREHQLLRSKLTLVDSALAMGSEAWFLLRELSFTLAKQLQAHHRREAQLLQVYRAALQTHPIAHVAVDHAGEQVSLTFINQGFVAQPPESLKTLRPLCAALSATLRCHMDQQEAQFFPALEEILVLQALAGRQESLAPSGLRETMTVREITSRYPGTKSVLEGLFIDSRYEGYDCLDEVAWRHGMESRNLLARLEEELAAVPCISASS